MSVGDLITDDLQIEFNGLLMGADSTNVEVVSFTPFEQPDVRSTDVNRPLDHGMFVGDDYYAGHVITLQGEVWGGWDAMRSVINAFKTGGELPIVWQVPTVGKLRALVRVRKRAGLSLDTTFAVAGTSTFAVEMYATDPRVYSNTIKTAQATLAATSSGMTFDATFDLVFGAGSSPTVSVNNEGTFETRPLIRINGQVDNPSLINETTGKTLAFTGSLAAGDYLDIDFLNRTVLLNGTASRYSWVNDSAGWWTLQPGVNSIRLGGSPGSPTPTADITWRDAYA